MKKVKFTVEMPSGDYCGDCPCLGLNGKEEEMCGFFNRPLDICNGDVKKCGECKTMTKMLLNEDKKKNCVTKIIAEMNEGKGRKRG